MIVWPTTSGSAAQRVLPEGVRQHDDARGARSRILGREEAAQHRPPAEHPEGSRASPAAADCRDGDAAAPLTLNGLPAPRGERIERARPSVYPLERNRAGDTRPLVSASARLCDHTPTRPLMSGAGDAADITAVTKMKTAAVAPMPMASVHGGSRGRAGCPPELRDAVRMSRLHRTSCIC